LLGTNGSTGGDHGPQAPTPPPQLERRFFQFYYEGGAGLAAAGPSTPRPRLFYWLDETLPGGGEPGESEEISRGEGGLTGKCFAIQRGIKNLGVVFTRLFSFFFSFFLPNPCGFFFGQFFIF